jgi:lipopolysaccharide/colanic/teichoic acid biosynthesis glycosyltransferase
LKDGRLRYKRSLDLAILILAHLTLLPLWVGLWTVIPFLIWLEDRGPVFYPQARVGKNGKVFTLLKFRSMVPDAEQKGPVWTTSSDPRITKVGKLLRKTALDELPEILSIWKGDMSFVGPRALAVAEQRQLEEEIPDFRHRTSVKPGLTGLAQVYNVTDNAVDKLRYDLEYIEGASLWLDLKLMVLSVRNTLLARWDQRAGKPATERMEQRFRGDGEPQ